MSANYSLRVAPVAAPAVALLVVLLMLRPVTILADYGGAPTLPPSPWSPSGQPNPEEPAPSDDAPAAVDPRAPKTPFPGPFSGAALKPGTVTVFEIEVTMEMTPTNNSSVNTGYEPIWVPHCALGRFLDDRSRLELDPPIYKEGIFAVIVIHYSWPDPLRSLGDDRLVMPLAASGRAPVSAVWNLSTVLYWIDPAASSPVQPARAAQADSGLVGSYVTDFPPDRWSLLVGPTLVEETHVVTGVYQIPLSEGPDRVCR